MGLNQGLMMLQRGGVRKLTPSEVNKGYIFITNDKAAQKRLGETFTCVINGQKFFDRRIDRYGRIGVGRELTRSLEGISLQFKLESPGLTIKSL